MNHFSAKAALTVFTLMVATPLAAMPITNMSFESGLDGYHVKGSASAVTSTYAWDDVYYAPTDGDWFVRLDAQGSNTKKYGGTTGAELSTHVSLDTGQALSFDWAFLGFDFLPYVDFALFSADTDILLADLTMVGTLGMTDWQTYNWVPDRPYSGNVRFVVSNADDQAFNSSLLLDNLRIGPSIPQVAAVAIPEPGLLALCGLGLLVMGAARRLRP